MNRYLSRIDRMRVRRTIMHAQSHHTIQWWQHYCYAASSVMVCFAVYATCFISVETALANDVGDTQITRADCMALAVWPIEHAKVVQPFNAPEQPWLSGRRGVDIASEVGQDIIAPVDAIISFQGLVATKSVVSLTFRDMTFTFEPAVSNFETGTVVQRGDIFGKVQGNADHCAEMCLHWGLKRNGGYLDPSLTVKPSRIILKSP